MRQDVVRIEMLGGFRVILNGRVIEHFRTRKAASLLARLALFPERAHPREELIDLLWPDMDVEAGRVNLRQALCSLRHLLEVNSESQSFILADNASVRLVPAAIVTDVGDFEAELKTATEHVGTAIQSRVRAIELYQGDLLNGLYDEWIFPERRRLESLYLGALREQLIALAQSSDPARAVPFALRAIQIDPCDEDAHLAAMRLYASMGDPTSVRRQLDELTRTLHNELEVPPSPAALHTAERLLAEAKSNETAMAIHKSVTYSNLPPRPIWKRAPAALAACACLAIFIEIPNLASHKSHASGNSKIAPYDATLAELRTLRTQGFVTGSNTQRDSARRRHAQICIALGESAWNCWYGRDEEKWLKRFTESNEELRTALHWLLENDPEKAVQLSGTLTRFWYVRNFPREGYRWLSDSLEKAPKSRTTERARALVGSALLSTVYNAKTEGQCREALSICTERGDKWGEAHALRHLGFLAGSKAEFDTAKRYYDQALVRFTEIVDDRGRAVTFLCLSFLNPNTEGMGYSACRKYAAQSLELFKKLDNPWGISMALNSLGNLEPDTVRARAFIQQAIAAYPEANGLSEKELHEHAIIALRRGDHAVARRLLVRELEFAKDRSNRMGVAFALEYLIGFQLLEPACGARLFGAVTALDEKLGINTHPRLDLVRNKIIAKLGEDRFNSAVQAGRKLSWEQAVDETASMD